MTFLGLDPSVGPPRLHQMHPADACLKVIQVPNWIIK